MARENGKNPPKNNELTESKCAEYHGSNAPF